MKMRLFPQASVRLSNIYEVYGTNSEHKGGKKTGNPESGRREEREPCAPDPIANGNLFSHLLMSAKDRLGRNGFETTLSANFLKVNSKNDDFDGWENARCKMTPGYNMFQAQDG